MVSHIHSPLWNSLLWNVSGREGKGGGIGFLQWLQKYPRESLFKMTKMDAELLLTPQIRIYLFFYSKTVNSHSPASTALHFGRLLLMLVWLSVVVVSLNGWMPIQWRPEDVSSASISIFIRESKLNPDEPD